MSMEWIPGMNCKICGSEYCKCIKCELCKKRVAPKNICLRCYKCRCHHDTYNIKDFPLRPCFYLTDYDTTTYNINPLRRHMGIELEMGYFGYIKETTPEYEYLDYDIVHDGSVAESGSELVTTRSIGDKFVLGLTELGQDIIDARCTVNNSCGFHVHVNAADFDAYALRRVLVTWYLVQHKMYGSMISSERANAWGQQYCALIRCDPAALMMLDKPQFMDWLHKWLYSVDMPDKSFYDNNEQYKQALRNIDRKLKELKSTKYINAARRMNLNFHSWMMRGTLEFRLKEGSVDPKEIIMWPLWCGWFIETIGLHTTDKQVNYWLKNLPSIQDLTEHMANSVANMPEYIMEWVKTKC